MRNIIAISDTHGSTPTLPYSDLLLICGDISPYTCSHHPTQQLHWFRNHFLPWVKTQADQVVFIAGNHDFFLQKMMKDNSEKHFKKVLPKNVHYLRDSMVEINNLKIYGTPWVSTYGHWAFMAYEETLFNYYDQMPQDIDILLCHGPAYSLSDQILDPAYFNKNFHSLGSKSLQRVINTRNIKHFYYGHIHTADHKIQDYILDNGNTMQYCCVSILDEYYKPTYVPYQSASTLSQLLSNEDVKTLDTKPVV
jgi:Icc-related predicted phosphoesterase